jgi:hypothetical protein
MVGRGLPAVRQVEVVEPRRELSGGRLQRPHTATPTSSSSRSTRRPAVCSARTRRRAGLTFPVGKSTLTFRLGK